MEEIEEKKEENENSSCMSLTHSSLSQPKVAHIIHVRSSMCLKLIT